MSLEYIRNYYNVPAEVGRIVEYTSQGETKRGVITGATNQYINIHFNGDKKPRGPFHPTDGITYHGIGKVPKISRSRLRYMRWLEVGDCFENFRQFLEYETRRERGEIA